MLSSGLTKSEADLRAKLRTSEVSPAPLNIPQCQQLTGGRPVTVGADPSWGVEQDDAEAEILVERSHAIGAVVRQDHGAGMAREPLGETHLIVP